MADRYWVGGAGTWDTTSTTNWSASTGGASGASVPTSADNVFFDQAGTYTVTVNGALACLDITVSAGTATFSGAGFPTLTVAGSMSLLAATTWSAQTTFTFTATTTGKTVTASNPFSVSAFNFNGVGGGWTLGSAISLPVGSFIVTAGSVNSANYSITCSQLVAQGTSVRSLTLGSSTVTVNATSSNAIACGTITNLTFNAGTSQINLTGGSTTGISSGGLTFYNVAFTSTAAGTKTVTGVNTFNNFAVTAPSAAGVTNLTFSANQTINGTLSTTGTAGNSRVFFASANYGIAQTLTVNSAASLTDADFRDIYIIGISAPISGTRIGNRGGCRGITFSTPKTVYWGLASAGGGWSGNAWALTDSGAVSTDNFPLPQDTATFTDTNPSASQQLNIDGLITSLPNIDFSGRTTAMTFSFNNTATTCYGNWKTGSGITYVNGGTTLTFSGGTTQTITSAGKTLGVSIIVDTYGGTVQLADALNLSTSSQVYVTNGTFTTVGYAVTAGSLLSNNSNVRTINLGASTVTLNGTVNKITFTTTNLTFNAGTSNIIVLPDAGNNWGVIDCGSGVVFYDMSVTGDFGGTQQNQILGACTFRNLTIVKSAQDQINRFSFNSNITVTGTLTVSSTTAVRRITLLSTISGTRITITAGAFSGADCDFQDINLAGLASGASPTRAGDCGNNLGITFPVAKTVYWNLAGTQNWSAIGWATSSGGTPAVNNFPLAQDTAVFNNAGSAGTVTIERNWNIGTFDASLRTTAMTLSSSTSTLFVYGDWKFGTGVTSSSTTGTLTFSKNGTQTITSNGVQFGCPIIINHPSAYVQIANALSLNSGRGLTLTLGTFDAVSYNVTIGGFAGAASTTLKMGSGTWTLSSTGVVWNQSASATQLVGTSTIVLSDTSTGSRTFTGGGLYYNKLTIGGATGTSTLTITDNNTFGELASTKTVAHTIAFGTTVQTFGAWTVTGTVGNVVTITGTGVSHVIAGARVSGVNYLAMGTIGFIATSPGEFYAGANSTGTGTGVILTAAPTATTRYWRGGAGTWNATNTTNWSASSGGAGGASVPTSVDTVIFNSASNATAYTVTVSTDAARCGTLTIGGPAAGNLTINSSSSIPLIAHGDVTFAATGVVSSNMSGGIVLSGSTTNQPFVSDVLVVGGGGAGGHLGGGGAGGHRYFTNESLVANTNYTVTVGLGGAASTGATGNQGLNSVFNTYTSAGGGGGAGEAALPAAGGSGGGGGGLAGTSRPGAAGNTPSTSPSQGNTGGDGNDNGAGTAFAGGGGGGAGGTGNNASGTTTAGNGGVGTANSITGSSVTRAAGGGGGAYQISGTGTAGTGGSSIGGNGGRNGLNATSGSPNTGSGGGGNGLNASGNLQGSSGAGGSGVVIIKYLNNLTISNPGGGLTFTTDSASVAGYKITTFTAGTGTVSFNATADRLFTTNGVALTANTDVIRINGAGCGWTLGSATNLGANAGFNVVNGSFSTANYNVTAAYMLATGSNKTSITLGSSTLTLAGFSGAVNFGTTPSATANLTFNAGTSQITINVVNASISGNGNTFYNVAFTGTSVTNHTVRGANVFNNFSISGITSVGVKNVSFEANQTINGTLTISAGTDATMRNFLQSNTLGTTRTLTCAAFSATDADFRDITIAGAISSITFNIAGAQTWTVPAGVTSATIKLWGAGGGSGGNGYIEGGGGGGGGAFASKVLTVTPAQVLSFTVGTGGGAGGYNGFGQTVGATGTASTHSTITAGGGLGGGDGVGGAGGAASGGDVNTSGQSGFGSFQGVNSYKGGLAGNSPNATAASDVVPYSGLQPGGGQTGGGGDFAGKGGDGRVTFEWSAISLPVSGTRLGDCLNNSGIAFPAAKTVYWNLTGTVNWYDNGWAPSSGGVPNLANFPLAQDTAIFDNAGLLSTCNLTSVFNMPSVNMSARTTSGTVAITASLSFYGDIRLGGALSAFSVNGTTTLSGQNKTVTINYNGQGSTSQLTIDAPGGTVQMQGAININNNSLTLNAGTLITNNYNISGPGFATAGTLNKVLQLGSSVITSTAVNGISNSGSGLTVTGTGTFSLTSAGAKTFAGNGLNYSGITLNQGGAGTLTIQGNNTFANITNSYKATGATNISFGTTTQTVGSFTASGEVGRILTIQGSSAASPATLILTGAIKPNVDYSAITGVRAYPLADTWYALTSTNNGSLGFIYNAELAAIVKKLYLGGSNTLSVYYGSKPVNSIYYGSVKIFG